MLKETKNKIAASFQEQIKALKEEIKGIDEKYKKLADEEKKELKEMLSYFKEQRDALLNGAKFVVTPAATEPADDSINELPFAEEEEPDIVDSVFPENNVSDEQPEDTTATEVVETEEDNTDSTEETPGNDELSDIWPDEQESSAEETSSESASEDDGWPEMPEEWK